MYEIVFYRFISPNGVHRMTHYCYLLQLLFIISLIALMSLLTVVNIRYTNSRFEPLNTMLREAAPASVTRSIEVMRNNCRTEHEFNTLPWIYVITPTYKRLTQMTDLTRLVQLYMTCSTTMSVI
jgi:hypothetical protein